MKYNPHVLHGSLEPKRACYRLEIYVASWGEKWNYLLFHYSHPNRKSAVSFGA